MKPPDVSEALRYNAFRSRCYFDPRPPQLPAKFACFTKRLSRLPRRPTIGGDLYSLDLRPRSPCGQDIPRYIKLPRGDRDIGRWRGDCAVNGITINGPRLGPVDGVRLFNDFICRRQVMIGRGLIADNDFAQPFDTAGGQCIPVQPYAMENRGPESMADRSFDPPTKRPVNRPWTIAFSSGIDPPNGITPSFRCISSRPSNQTCLASSRTPACFNTSASAMPDQRALPIAPASHCTPPTFPSWLNSARRFPAQVSVAVTV